MKRLLSWKIILIIVFAILLGYYDAPNSLQKIPGTPKFIKDPKIHLGLDLQGGIQLDYKIDLSKVPEKDQRTIIEGVREVINRRVNGLGVSEPNIFVSEVADEKHIIVELAGIKNLDEAKQTVGKTIQLEFKEEKGEPDPKEKDKILKQARQLYSKIQKKPSEFGTLGLEAELGNPGKIEYEEKDYENVDSVLSDEVKNLLTSLPVNGVGLAAKESTVAFDVDKNNNVRELKGFAIVKLIDKKEEVKDEKAGKEVETSHILIAYKGASKTDASVTRSQSEAEKLAEELLGKIKNGEIAFEDAAKKHSDEPGAFKSAGKLAEPVKENGLYVKAFTDAALDLEKAGDLSDVTETEFGFHIIRADKVTGETIKNKIEHKVKYQYIVFSTIPDPWKPTELTGQHFKHAQVEFTQLGAAQVAIEFTDEGGKLFEEITGRNVQKKVAIFVGGDEISAPVVQQKISGGQAVITGTFSAKDAQELARDLNTGAIPAPIVLTGQYSIGASLGEEALAQSIKAGILGLIILALFLILYYRLPGFLATLALSIYTVIFLFMLKSDLPLPAALVIGVLVFIVVVYKVLNSEESGWEKVVSFLLSCFILFFVAYLLSTPVVLTLAGVAGVILSIGMAVDANILIFERLKEELKAGRPLSSAIEVGFDRAWSSIRDSNFSSLITCAILYYFGTSIIQGFALTLAAGILISMFTAINISKTFLTATVNSRFARYLWLYGLPKVIQPKRIYDIIGKMKIWFAVSGIIILIGVISLFTNGLKWGLDFKGGTFLNVKFDKAVQVEEVRKLVPYATVISSGENEFILRMEHINPETHDKIMNDFKQNFGNTEEVRFTTMGPTVGDTLKKRAGFSLALALLCIVLYIAFAFRKIPRNVSPWKFGLCAIAALIHDVVIPIGIFSLLRVEIDAFFITALLTIIGFSVHDTIVVFDRIRENLKMQAPNEPFAEVANKSVTQTLARSINTSLTTIITLLALLFFGSPSVFYFSLALALGIFFGTYSSIFIASPLLVLWQKRRTLR